MAGAALSIGEVINLLKDEFPDVTVSKVRFLENQGLIRPSRSSSGYRQFFSDDVKRLRYILQQQRDHFLPLKVIKSKLTLWERGEEPLIAPPPGPHPESYFAVSGSSMSTEEIQAASGLSEDQVSELVRVGMLTPSRDGTFPEEMLIVAREAFRLLSYGLETRHLRQLMRGSDQAAELIDQLTAGLRRNRSPDAKRRAAEMLAACSEAISRLHTARLIEDLRRLL